MKANLSQQMYVILLFGGLGIALGLATWGWRIIRSIGVKLAKITPSRGFCIELSTAMVVVVGSRLGIPLSTTHCQVGATVGVALLEGYSGVNCGLTFKIVMGWIATLILCAATSALLFAQGAYAPCAA
jgi:sodium-dependent phosphate transporter